jgi:hypothetical protein
MIDPNTSFLGAGHTIVVIIHVLLFVYWLGGDLGVFYSSKFVARRDLSPEARAVASKIMLDLDLIPRCCMALMLTVGGILTEFIGIPHPTYQMVGIILLGPVWLFCVLYLHFRHGGAAHAAITKFDMFIRYAVVIGIPISVWVHWDSNNLGDYPWVAAKLIIFALLVLCGIMIRRYLDPFISAVIEVRQGKQPSAEDDDALDKSLFKVRIFVFSIWVGVFIEGFIGIANRSGVDYSKIFGG